LNLFYQVGGFLSSEENIRAFISGDSSLWKNALNQALASLNSSVGSIINAFGDEIRRKDLSPDLRF
jgi:hypothetical protein